MAGGILFCHRYCMKMADKRLNFPFPYFTIEMSGSKRMMTKAIDKINLHVHNFSKVWSFESSNTHSHGMDTLLRTTVHNCSMWPVRRGGEYANGMTVCIQSKPFVSTLNCFLCKITCQKLNLKRRHFHVRIKLFLIIETLSGCLLFVFSLQNGCFYVG